MTLDINDTLNNKMIEMFFFSSEYPFNIEKHSASADSDDLR